MSLFFREKALVATGDTGVQEASEWSDISACVRLSFVFRFSCFRILSHVFDPELDKAGGRDFVVYAMPLGGLGAQLGELWDTSLAQTGRNGAHKSFPHVTLCQFFKVGERWRVVVGCEVWELLLDCWSELCVRICW